MIRTNTYLRQDQDEALEQIIKDTGFGKKAQLVRKAVDEFIEKHKKHPLNNIPWMGTGWKSLGLPDWADKLPEKLDIGKRIKVVKGHSWVGKSGIVKTHFINGDDCGDWGKSYYNFIADDNKEQYAIRTENCEFID